MEIIEHQLCEIQLQPPALQRDSPEQRDTFRNSTPEAWLWQLHSCAAQSEPNPKLLSATLTRLCCFTKLPFILSLSIINNISKPRFRGALHRALHHHHHQAALVPNKKRPSGLPQLLLHLTEETQDPVSVPGLSAICWMTMMWLAPC